MKENYLLNLREGRELTLRQQIAMTIQLSLPAILAQISSIIMQYIDASMVGRLGAGQSASIGLMSSSMWLFGGLCTAVVTGFSVQTAQEIGAGGEKNARDIMKHAFIFALGFGFLLSAVGAALASPLPHILGGNEDICRGASEYFLVYVLSLPFVQLNNISSLMLQSSGNMRTPSILHAVMCGLDVIFNLFFIFPSWSVFGITFPGAGLGVMGAALGTAAAQVVISCVMTCFLLTRSPILGLRRGEPFHICGAYIKRSVRISVPVAIEQTVLCGAQIMSTVIVAPLGTVAIAANSFAITVESLCYMPGYGIETAAAAIIGQSTGAGRTDLTRKLGWITTGLGMGIMTVTGILMYIAAPWMIGLLTKDADAAALGAAVLRIEAFAEPLYAASIVASGVFRGAGDTLVPSCLNFCSMWMIRLPLAAFLSGRMGLKGVWTAMCIELCVRGILFLIRLKGRRWQRHTYVSAKTDTVT